MAVSVDGVNKLMQDYNEYIDRNYPRYNDITYISQKSYYNAVNNGDRKYIFVPNWNCQDAFCKEAYYKDYRWYERIIMATVLLDYTCVAVLIIDILRIIEWSYLLSFVLIAILLSGSAFVHWFAKQDGLDKMHYAKFIQVGAVVLSVLMLLFTDFRWISALCVAMLPLPLMVEGVGARIFHKRFMMACLATTLYDYMYGRCFYLATYHPSGKYTQIKGNLDVAKEAGYAYADGYAKIIPM